MKIITLLGSPKPKGNTATILGWTEEALQAQGHSVERIEVVKKQIGGCMGCLKCHETPDAIGCVQKDDANGILERMLDADCVLFTSPVYFWGLTSQAKAIMDRCYAFVTEYHKPEHASLLRGKTVGLLTTGGGAVENNVEGIFDAFDRFKNFLLADGGEKIHFGGCRADGVLPESHQAQAVEFAGILVGEKN